MKKTKHLSRVSHCLLTATFLLLLTTSSRAQSLPTDAFVTMQATNTAGVVSGNYFVEVPDTTNVSQIEIKLGSNPGLADYVNQVFDYDVTTGLPTGYTYSRTGRIINISIGNRTEDGAYYGQVRIKNNSGSWSAVYPFVSN